MIRAIPVEARGRAFIDIHEDDVSTRFLELFETIQIFGWKIWARTWITVSFGVMAGQMVCWVLRYTLMWHLYRNRFFIYKWKLLKATAVLHWDYTLECWQGTEVPVSLLPLSTGEARNGAFPTGDTFQFSLEKNVYKAASQHEPLMLFSKPEVGSWKEVWFPDIATRAEITLPQLRKVLFI